MIQVAISDVVTTACPDLHVAVLFCEVQNSLSDVELWDEISDSELEIRATEKLENINKFRPIQATRQAYKCFGKDPNRYRPSAEALRRRILRGLPLYKIDTLVDIINLVSIKTGYSIGGFDADKIQGDLILGVGRKGEIYHGIGRGDLNIEGLPVYRDNCGGVGTPTSDEERTKIDLKTTRLLMIINAYSGLSGLKEAVDFSSKLLKKYVSARKMEAMIISGDNKNKIML